MLGIQIIWVIFPSVANPHLCISFSEVLGKTTVIAPGFDQALIPDFLILPYNMMPFLNCAHNV